MSENISREICKLRIPSKINPLQSACSLGILRFWPIHPLHEMPGSHVIISLTQVQISHSGAQI